MRFTLRFLILCSYIFTSQEAFGKELVSSYDLIQSEAFSRFGTGNEFMSGQEAGVVMMKVNLWGAVKKPGIHHIPVKTDLISLMSYAGGPNDNAKIDSVVIKRNQGKLQKKINVDLAQLIHDEDVYDLTLQPEDIIVVPAKQPWVSQDFFMLAIVASTLASIMLSAVLIEDRK